MTYQYTLSTAYVPSTATLSHQTAAFEAEVDFILFNWDWTKVFVILDNSKLWVATLSSAWDLSTMWALTTTDISSYLYSWAQVYRMAMFLSDLEDKLFLTDWYKTLYQFSIDNWDVTNIQLVNQYEFNNDQITYWAVYPNNDWNYRFYRFDWSNPSKIYQHTL